MIGLNIDDVIQKLKDVDNDVDNSKLNTTDIFALKDSSGAVTELGRMSESVDKMQTAYTGLKNAIDSYNSSGRFTIDQIQDILSYGDQYLQYLVNENGELELNKQTLVNVAYARMQEMKAKVLSNMMDRVESIKNEASANEYLAETLYKVADAATTSAQARLKDWYSNALGRYKISENVASQVRDKVSNEMNAIETMFNKVDYHSAFGTTAKQSAEEATAAFKGLMDAELKALDARMEAGLVKYDDYLKQRLALIESYKGKVTDADYYSALADNYKNELSYMDKGLSAVNRIIDDKIKAYNDEVKALEKAHEEKIKQIDEEIQRLEDQKEALQDDNDEIERQLSLEQALYDLERAQTQRSKKVYTGDKGYVYTTDQDAIRDAQESVRQSKLDIQIAKIDDSIKLLQKQEEELEEKLEAEREAIEKNIEDLEEYQNKWKEATSKYQEDQENMVAAAIWGKDWESVVLQDRTTALTNFTNAYVELQQNQANAALAAAEAIEVAERKKAAAIGSSIPEPNGTNMDTGSATTSPTDTVKSIRETGASALKHSDEYKLMLEALKCLGSFYGYKVNTEGNLSDPETKKTIEKFQKVFNLGTHSGIMDNVTYRKLREVALSEKDYDWIPFLANMTNKKTQAWDVLGRGKNEKWKNLPKKLPSYAKGGIISSSNSSKLDALAQQVGEDHIVAAKDGERVLTPVQNEMWEKWTEALPNLQNLSSMIKVNVPDYSNLNNIVNRNSIQTPVVQYINLTLPNVTNEHGYERIVKELKQAQLDAMQYVHRRK